MATNTEELDSLLQTRRELAASIKATCYTLGDLFARFNLVTQNVVAASGLKPGGGICSEMTRHQAQARIESDLIAASSGHWTDKGLPPPSDYTGLLANVEREEGVVRDAIAARDTAPA